jgi:transcription elongation factor SPT5
MSDKFEVASGDDLNVEDTSFDDNNQDYKIEEINGAESNAAIEDQLQANSEIETTEGASPANVLSTQSKTTTTSSGGTQPTSDSKFFAIRTTGGQERVVASQIQVRVNSNKIGIRSVMVLDSFKGYIIVEAPDSNVAYEAMAGIRHVRGQIRGDLPFKDIEGYLVKKPVVSELNIDDTVEVIAGPFKSMKAKITRVDYEKQEATVVLLDSPYQIPVTVDANYLKKIAH